MTGGSIPYIIFVNFFFTYAFLGLQILHPKVHKFTTKLSCEKTLYLQNSAQSHNMNLNYTLNVKQNNLALLSFALRWINVFLFTFCSGFFYTCTKILHLRCRWRRWQISGMINTSWFIFKYLVASLNQIFAPYLSQFRQYTIVNRGPILTVY